MCSLTKISVCLTYLRIFPSRTSKLFCYSAIPYEIGWGLATFFAYLFQCVPIQSYWFPTQYPNRRCVDQAVLLYATAALNNLSDFLIPPRPIRDLWKVRLPFKQRIGLIIMFTIGVLVCVAGICRICYLTIFFNSYDIFYNAATVYVINAIETDFAIICGCLPSCKPLMVRWFPRLFGSNSETTHPSTRKGRSLPPNSQSFPFQELQGGILKEDAFRVEYSDGADRKRFETENNTSNAAPAAGEDAESEEGSISHEDSRASPGVSATRIV